MTRAPTVALALLFDLFAAGPATAAAPATMPAGPPPGAVYKTYELAEEGVIGQWLVLGYLSGHTPPDRNRLDAIGGEENLSPWGGQEVTLQGLGEKGGDLRLVWRTTQVRPPEIPYYMIAARGLHLFVDEKGSALPNCTAYACCDLIGDQDRTLWLRMSEGEPVRIWLNGQVLSLPDRRPHLFDGPARTPIVLKKGLNRLLVRLDNRWGDEFLCLRVVDEAGEPASGVKVGLRVLKEAAAMPGRYLAQDWNALRAEIPPVPPSPDEAYFGAQLGRTMTLLETGGQTRRPVRICFYGQSITASEWVWLLVRRLRERYPQTEIQAENFAISGWGIDKLNRTIKHDVLRARPDLVVIHAYQGGSWEWERIIQKIRRETTAEILFRSAHIDGGDAKFPKPDESGEAMILRRLARTYGCEMVDCRLEWLNFLRIHQVDPKDLRSDGIHLNHKGAVLMAQLYERHFRRYPVVQPWFQTVRRYEAMRPLADREGDEVRLEGDGWHNAEVNCAISTGQNDRLKLTFRGNRVDLIMPQHGGRARVLVDNRPVSAWNLLQGTRPASFGKVPAHLMTYYAAPDAWAEKWELTFTHVSGDHRKFRYRLTGSRTGPDGEGDQSAMFVSRSGRITINPDDFLPDRSQADETKTQLEPVKEACGAGWRLAARYGDEVRGAPAAADEAYRPRYDVPYRYVTVVDGLPPGEHELVLLPVPAAGRHEAFAIDAVEVHCPPLWGK